MDTVSYVHLPADQPPPPRPPQPFRAIVIIEQTVSNEWLVRAGCLYMLAWGQDCSAWDDSVDYANIAAFEYEDIPGDKFVMTTWHDKQPLSEVLWFASHCASHDAVQLAYTLILHIAPNAREAELMAAYRAAANG